MPLTADQVASCVLACAARGLPVVPRGAGTGVEGGCIPYNGGVVIATERLRTINLNKEDMVCTVGAGVRKLELNR
jgi:D-lactate dehydrogenase (cytochrome)